MAVDGVARAAEAVARRREPVWRVGGEAAVEVPLPGGRVWFQRLTPDPDGFARWCAALAAMASEPDNGRLRAEEQAALLAAYDGGWNVAGADGAPVPPPAALDLAGWNAVPREVIGALLDYLDAQATAGLRAAAARRASASASAGEGEAP